MPISTSLIVPTRNRSTQVAETLRGLSDDIGKAHIEVVVVDDGSEPPLSLPSPRVRIVRTSGIERSRARNLGALSAQGNLLVFVDDDISVPADFVARHERAAADFGDALCVGGISERKRFEGVLTAHSCGRGAAMGVGPA